MSKGNSWFYGLSHIVQILLALFLGWIVCPIVRIASGKPVNIVVGILGLVTGNFAGILWLIDLIFVILKKKLPLGE